MGEKSSLAHGITTKFLPFVFVLMAWFYISDFTRGYILLIDPTDMYLGISGIAIFLVLLYEGANHLPRKNTSFGFGGAMFLFIFAGANLFFATLVLTDFYQPLSDTGDFNLVYQIVFGVGVLVILAQGIYEVATYKRLLADKIFS